MKEFFNKTKHYITHHKKMSAGILIGCAIIGYGLSKTFGGSATVIKYVVANVELGTVASSVSGTGQVSASNQIDLKSKVSGDIVSVNVNTGNSVNRGATLASINSTDASLALRTAEISYAKTAKPTDAATLIAAQNSLANSQATLSQAQSDLSKAYEDGYNNVSSSYLDLPDIISGLNDLLYTQSGYLSDSNVAYAGDTAIAYRNTAADQFDAARKKYDTVFALYKSTSRDSALSTQESIITSTYDAVRLLTDAIKSSKNAVDYIRDQGSSQSRNLATTADNNLLTWTDKTNTIVTNLLSSKTAIVNSKDTIVSSTRDITEKTASLQKLQSGADPLDIESSQITLDQKRTALQDYFITAPFSGLVGKMDVKVGDSVNSGTVIATLITTSQVADISLNEVDAAKVKVGNKATMTFDAIDGLTISGTVSEIDLVGTVTQGVVTYNAKITLDTSDVRIRPSMSVSATIITNVKQDTLFVPASAVKSDAQGSYVLMFDTPLLSSAGSAGTPSNVAPQAVPIEVGISSDSSVEILSGIKEGDQVVTRTISPSTTTTASAPSLFGGSPRTTTGGAGRALGR